MIEKLIIVGAGGFGREIAFIVESINYFKPTWQIMGFIDDDTNKNLHACGCSYEILGPIRDHIPMPDVRYVCAIAEPAVKALVMPKLKHMGAKFARIVHPSVYISPQNKIGEGFVAYPGAVITTNVTIGDFVTLLISCLGHDVEVGDFATISSLCDVTGGVKIGKRAFLGSHAAIVPGKKIGDDAYVGVGSVVIRNVKNHCRVFGNPAQLINL